jgi:hypothetical protein
MHNISDYFFEKKIWVFITCILFLIILAFSYSIRCNFLYAIKEHQINNQSILLNRDSKDYYHLGLSKKFPCFSSYRDPFIIIVSHSILNLFGNIENPTGENNVKNNELLRYTSIIINLCALTMFFIFTTLVVNKKVALIASFLWSSNIFSIKYSVAFLRIDLVHFFTFLLLTLILLLLRFKMSPSKNTIKRSNQKDIQTPDNIFTSIGLFSYIDYRLVAIYSLVIIAGACLILTRMSMFLIFFILLLGYNIIQVIFKSWRKYDLYCTLTAFILSLLIVLPYLVYNKQNTGAFFSSSNKHARFWFNQEFAGEKGFYSREEVMKSPYIGKDISVFEYILLNHSIPEVATRFIKGYYLAFTHYLKRLYQFILPFGFLPPGINLLLYLLSILGIFLCITPFSKENLLILFASLIFIFPFVFILPLNTVISPYPLATGVELRFTMPLLPFAFIYTAKSIDFIYTKIIDLRFKYSKKKIQKEPLEKSQKKDFNHA